MWLLMGNRFSGVTRHPRGELPRRAGCWKKAGLILRNRRRTGR
jgi:hypothetical protein